jgi:hypothetical protein
MSNLSVLQNITEVRSDPFPYVCVEGAMPDRFYRELEATFPEDMIVNNTQPHDGGICYRFKCKEATMWQPPAIWQDFFAYHSSTEYFRACAELFAPHIVAAYGEEFYENLKTKPVSVRDVDNSGHYVTDCQFVVHEPVDQTGTSRTPHVDNPVEIYAGLLYMRKQADMADGGNFTVHRVTGQITEVNKSLGRQVDNSLHEPVFEVPYRANNFCMFLNVKDSVHSVTPRIAPTERRHSINIIGEFNGTGKMWKVREIKN